MNSRNPWRVTWQVAKKEMKLFLSSPIAWLFFISFAAVTLFIFFWAEAFFARNIADVRPMFEWMPILLILLCSTLAMRMWSEERRTGTLEHVLTQSAPLWSFALGKYLACMGLLILALIVMLPLPLSLSFITTIDWGPVLAGYLATLLLGSAYLAIGLFISSRTQNQIVSLIGSVALCGVFYFLGHTIITRTLGQSGSELIQSLGTGTRFDAITRGVIDVADLAYYISLTLIFLALTVYALEKERWTSTSTRPVHRRWQFATGLLILNAIALNLWIGQMDNWRVDTTKGKQYTLSDATRNYLAQLQEPLTLRGYFSSKTHPLLSPLVPQMKDLLREYEVAGDGRVRVEIIDPMRNPEAEEEANQQYGIEPVPFQMADRYQSSIVSSYFDVLVQYGDEYDVLSFRDLIDIKSRSESDIDVQLRNPEYDLTKSIRRVLTDFQSAGDVFASISKPLTLNAYVSADDQLPADLAKFRQIVSEVVSSLGEDAAAKLTLNMIDPQENGGALANQLGQDYGLRPMRAGLFSDDSFWFHMLLDDGGQQIVQIPLGDLTQGEFENNLDAGLKRFASGFTRKIAYVGATPNQMAMQQGLPPGPSFRTLEDYLRAEYDLVNEDLSDGSVASDADLLLLASPENLDEKSLFAIDQFLMQGGTVIAATSDWSANLSRNSLDLANRASGLNDWLAHHGITMGDELVMDAQNAAFPVPVSRNVGGMQLQEMRMLDYPFFVDIRQNAMNTDSPIVAGLDQVTMAWASPITFAEDQGERETSVLLSSSPNAWLTSSNDIMPRLEADNSSVSPWQPDGETGQYALAVASQGRFDSYFAGKASPVAQGEEKTTVEEMISEDSAEAAAGAESPETEETTLAQNVDNVIEKSTESARLIVFASNDFLRDQITQLAGSVTGTAYLAPFQLMANTADVALEDTGLLSIRSRGQFNRTLPPMANSSQKFWEYLNYVLAALAIALVYGLTRLWRRHTETKQLKWLAS
ncbi:MAG: Gldg family protein [Granulosicoccus sp.]|nr:Gldg family protein [Granulosicoccus sp.]